MEKIDPKSATSYYRQLANILIMEIQQGGFPPNSLLPCERTLATLFRLNRTTVRQALELLGKAGVVYRVQGKGTFIKPSTPPAMLPSTPTLLRCAFHPRSEIRPIIESIAGQFGKSNPDVKLIIDDLHEEGDDPHLSALTRRLKPHVIELNEQARYAACGLLEPLDQFPDFDVVTAPMVKKLCYSTKNAQAQEHPHALPYIASSRMMLINKKIAVSCGLNIYNPPATWDDLMEWFETIRRNKAKANGRISGTILPLWLPWYGIIQYLPLYWMLADQSDLLDIETCRANFHSSAGREWFRFFREIYEREFCLRQLDGTESPFLKGETAIEISETSIFAKYCREKVPPVDYVVAPIPVPRQGVRPCTVLGARYLGIFSGAIENNSEREAAWRWIKFMISEETQRKIAGSITSLAVRWDVGDSFQEGTDMPKFHDCMKYGKIQPDHPYIKEVLHFLMEALKSATVGTLSVEQALETAEKQVNTLLQIGKPERDEFLRRI